jgi:peptide/nickel transport system substrate-binding protein
MFLNSWRRGQRLGMAVAAGAVVALALTACSGGASGGSTSAAGSGKTTSITVFNGATGTITENFNPFSPTLLQPTLGIIYEPLYYYNLATGKSTPMLATAYAWNTDGTKLTITTRQGVKWTDGQAFTAADVAYTFNLIAKTPALNTNNLQVQAAATDDHTVVLTFPQTSFTQEAYILGNQAIVAEHIWKNIADPSKDTNSQPVGTGPYTLKNFNPQTYVLAKNPHYWQAGKPSIDEVRYISLQTADAASAALTAGQVDWMSAFLPGLDTILKNQKDLSYVNTPAMTASIFTCSNADLGCTGPQTDPAVRQAIYWALDRTQLNKLAGGGFAATASPTMLLPERDASWIADSANKTTPAGPDDAKANALLDAAGWVKGSDGIRSKAGQRLTLSIQTVTGWSDFISLNDAMTQQLQTVGIELKPSQLSWNEWNNNEVQGTYQLSLDSIGLGASSNPFFTYNPRYGSANGARVGQAAGTSGNYARYSNPTVDQALQAAASTADPKVQAQAYATIETQVVKDMPYIPIYVNSMLTEFNNSRATGWPTNDNKYAVPASWKSWDNGVVLATIKPAGK